MIAFGQLRRWIAIGTVLIMRSSPGFAEPPQFVITDSIGPSPCPALSRYCWAKSLYFTKQYNSNSDVVTQINKALQAPNKYQVSFPGWKAKTIANPTLQYNVAQFGGLTAYITSDS